jgi:diketogulonate reductase-like aldo/keto reductase
MSKSAASCPIVSAHGADIPAIGLGTFPLKDEICEIAVKTALGVGYRHIDTASMYGNEVEVGRGLRASNVPRDQIFLTTKVWKDHIADGDLQRSAEKSLKALGVSHVDLLLIHWPNEAIPVAESVKALCDAKRRGLAKHIGVSNHTTALLTEAMRAATEPLVCNQFEYHPHLKADKIIAATRAAGLAIAAYCPLGRGDTGGVLAERAVADIAKAHGKSGAQVLLRWHLQQPGIVAIPKSATPTRIAENFQVFDFELTSAEMAAISALAKPGSRIVQPAGAPRWD